MQFTQQQYEAASAADILEYMQRNGYNVVKSGADYHLKEHDSLHISNNMWFWHSRGFGGGPIQFLTQYEQRSLPEAVTILADKRIAEHRPEYTSTEKQRASFVLPEANSDNRRVFAYLNKTRGIDPDIISELMRRHILYESKDYHNCVFVGLNENGEPAFAAQRSTNTQSAKPFKNDVLGSNKRNPFAMEGSSDRLYVFESAIDAMSYCTIRKLNGADWQEDNYIALGGVSDNPLRTYLERKPDIYDIVLCLDGDGPGQRAASFLKDDLHRNGCYNTSVELPEGKDFNEDLLNIRERLDEEMELE